MKKLLVLLLCASTGVYAESRVLPPVIDNSAYPGGAAYTNGTGAPSNNAMYEVLGRLEQMQQEIQQLRGVIEEQSQAIDDLKKRQSNIYLDLDQRMQLLAGGTDQKETTVEVDVQTEQTSVNNQLSNTNTEQTGKDTQPTASENMTRNDESMGVPVKNEKEIYLAAYELLRNGHNTQAIMKFKSFLVDFPSGDYSDNSQYWLGEAYKVNQDIKSSKKAFTKVVTDFPTSSKVPDALLKLGIIELEQNNEAKARDYFKRVLVSYPNTTAAHLAKKRLMLMESIQR